ncbi:alpha/beta-hydrolase [Thozetella sp. PMI_491]|nr:alpha/beta-hydrolase [Thozetella sp. PMI_491]
MGRGRGGLQGREGGISPPPRPEGTFGVAVGTGNAADCSLGSLSLNYDAEYPSTPQPFKLHVHEDFVEQTRLKASLTRLTPGINLPDFTDGIPVQNVSDIAKFWATQYDWRKVEDNINSKLQQFTTTVDAGENFTDPIPLHFIHHRSSRSDAIPLLFIHGWPSSSHEVINIIDILTNPPNSSLPAFHVVAPDIPGFGFSPVPRNLGLGLRETGQAFQDLMKQLGYDKYVGQGGDFGAHTLRYMAADFPDSVVSILLNMFIVFPNATDYERYNNNQTTPDETAQLSLLQGSSFDLIQAQWGIEVNAPLNLAISVGDSPVGWVAWQYLGLRLLTSGYSWGVEDLITWSMLNYIQGPYGGFRMYHEAVREGTLSGDFPYVTRPVGVLNYFGDATYNQPLEWSQRQGNITYQIQKSPDIPGGHVPVFINPDEMARDCWTFFGNASLSGVDTFNS